MGNGLPLSKFGSHEERTEEAMSKTWWPFAHRSKAASVEANLQDTNSTIVIGYHMSDHALAASLDVQLQLLALKLPFKLHFFGYPTKIPVFDEEQDYFMETLKASAKKEAEEYEKKRQKFAMFLEKSALFVPLISPTFLRQFWSEVRRDDSLNAHVSREDLMIIPIILRPISGVSSGAVKPLAAYDQGYQLEQACAAQVEWIEERLRQRYHPALNANTPLVDFQTHPQLLLR
jgi:hypothetical protein